MYYTFKGSIYLKKTFFIQESFNKLIYNINAIINVHVHLTACKISVSLLSLNWIKNEMIFFYRISELMLATLIQRSDKKSFHFKNERLTEILQAVRCHLL